MFNDLTKSSIIVYMKKSISTGESPLKYLLYICLFLICFCIGLIGGNRYFQYLSDEARPPEQKVVQVSIHYGLGNNMFQYAAGLAYALEHNKNQIKK